MDVERGTRRRFPAFHLDNNRKAKYGVSSIGRVAVSKTVGWGFESLTPCQLGLEWRGGRVVYRGGLENRFGLTPDGGSNPSLSAKTNL
jgi:hypothetical protein